MRIFTSCNCPSKHAQTMLCYIHIRKYRWLVRFQILINSPGTMMSCVIGHKRKSSPTTVRHSLTWSCSMLLKYFLKVIVLTISINYISARRMTLSSNKAWKDGHRQAEHILLNLSTHVLGDHHALNKFLSCPKRTSNLIIIQRRLFDRRHVYPVATKTFSTDPKFLIRRIVLEVSVTQSG